MTAFYRHCIRPVFFAQDSEAIHNHTLAALGWAARHALVCDAIESFFGAPALPVELFGLRFPNPVGLAAGMDKQAAAVPVWAALGFGFCELGGVTWHAQPGNEPPRMFRAVAAEALINRMGFNNPGAPALAETLARWRAAGRWPNHPVGINLGKSKITPLNKAAGDYANSFRALWPHADFFVVNVSSPNTPDLRQLQDKTALDEILAALQEINAERSAVSRSGFIRPISVGRDSVEPIQSAPDTARRSLAPPYETTSSQRPVAGATPPQLRTTDYGLRTPKPILVKVAPDLSFEALDEILELVAPRGIAGIVAANTTITRPEIGDPGLRRVYAEAGGLSGRPLARRSTEIIRHLHRQTGGALPIVGVGGIFSAADAWEKITAGASLVQLYTGLVYEGPGVVREIVTGLQARLDADGFRSLREAVGTATV